MISGLLSNSISDVFLSATFLDDLVRNCLYCIVMYVMYVYNTCFPTCGIRSEASTVFYILRKPKIFVNLLLSRGSS